jgi:hypothetical protein
MLYVSLAEAYGKFIKLKQVDRTVTACENLLKALEHSGKHAVANQRVLLKYQRSVPKEYLEQKVPSITEVINKIIKAVERIDEK